MEVEEACQDVRQRRLARSCRPRQQDSFTRPELHRDVFEDRRIGTRPDGTQTVEANVGNSAVERQFPSAGRIGRDARRHDTRSDLGDALRTGSHLTPGAEGERDRREDLEDRQRDECHHGKGRPVDPVVGESWNADGESSDGGSTRQRRDEGACEPDPDGTRAHGGGEPLVRLSDPALRVREATECRQHVEVAREVEHGVGNGGAETGDPALSGPGRPAIHQHPGQECEHQCGEEGDGCAGQQREHQPYAQQRDDAGGEQRLDHPQRVVLKLVHIVDQPGEQVAPPRGAQTVGSQGHEAGEDTASEAAELPEGRVVAGKAFEVTEEGAREGEGANADDRQRDVQERRLLGRSSDQPRRHREESHSGPGAEGAVEERGEQSARRRPRETKHLPTRAALDTALSGHERSPPSG